MSAAGAQDPSQWLPSAVGVHWNVAEWVATMLRWSLTADEVELMALREVASGCLGRTVTYEPAA